MNKEQTIPELLKQGNFAGAKTIIENKSKKPEKLYHHSPLNKTPETELFEKIVHQIIEDFDKNFDKRKINFHKDQNQHTIITLENNLAGSQEFSYLQDKFIQLYGEPVNLEKIKLKDLIDKTNFNHLELNKKDIEKYAELINKLHLEGRNRHGAPTKKEFIDSIERGNDSNTPNISNESISRLKNLEYGGMVAINRYTYHGDYYMNTLLRNADILVHIVFLKQ